MAKPLPKKIPNPTDKYVGSRVRMRRMMLSMSQEKLGLALGLTFQQVQKYEKGTNRIGASRLQQMSDILQVPVAFFFEGLPGAKPAKGLTASDLTTAFFSLPHANELAQAFTAIEDTVDRRVVRDVARAIAGRTAALRQAAE